MTQKPFGAAFMGLSKVGPTSIVSHSDPEYIRDYLGCANGAFSSHNSPKLRRSYNPLTTTLWDNTTPSRLRRSMGINSSIKQLSSFHERKNTKWEIEGVVPFDCRISIAWRDKRVPKLILGCVVGVVRHDQLILLHNYDNSVA
jgi:hypothetical protein